MRSGCIIFYCFFTVTADWSSFERDNMSHEDFWFFTDNVADPDLDPLSYLLVDAKGSHSTFCYSCFTYRREGEWKGDGCDGGGERKR